LFYTIQITGFVWTNALVLV